MKIINRERVALFRNNLSEEKKEKIRQKDRDRKLKYRETLSEEQKEKIRQYDREKMKLYRASLTEEQKEKIRQYDRERRLTDSARKRNRERMTLFRQNQSEEEKELTRLRSRERSRKYRATLSEEQKEKCRIRWREHNKRRPKKEMLKKMCNICGKKVSDVNSHILTVHGSEDDKKYRCQTCWKGFVHQSNLDIHHAFHLNERPFKCQFGCGFGSKTLGNLKVHEKGKHFQKRVYVAGEPSGCRHVCDTCHFETNKKSKLTFHIKSKHKQKEKIESPGVFKDENNAGNYITEEGMETEESQQNLHNEFTKEEGENEEKEYTLHIDVTDVILPILALLIVTYKVLVNMSNELQEETLRHKVMNDFPIDEDCIHVKAEAHLDKDSQRDRSKFKNSNEGKLVDENWPAVPKEDSGELFPCKYCNKFFSRVYHLNRHKQNVHSEISEETALFCNECNKSFKSKKGYTQHMLKVHKDKDKVHKCYICDYTTKYKKELDDHKLKCVLTCDLCGYKTKRKKNLVNHNKKCYREDDINRSDLNRTKKNLEKKFQCCECGKHFISKSKLSEHIDGVHKKIRKYHCDQCEKVFKRRGELVQHIQAKHENNKYFCEFCDYEGNTQKHLKRHIKSAHDKNGGKVNPSLYCDYCGYCATYNATLKAHIQNVHEGKKFPCNLCGGLYRQSHLGRHKQTVHEGKKYKCTETGCTSEFTQPKNVTDHISSVHHGFKYKCDSCHFQSSQKQPLKRHIKAKHGT